MITIMIMVMVMIITTIKVVNIYHTNMVNKLIDVIPLVRNLFRMSGYAVCTFLRRTS